MGNKKSPSRRVTSGRAGNESAESGLVPEHCTSSPRPAQGPLRIEVHRLRPHRSRRATDPLNNVWMVHVPDLGVCTTVTTGQLYSYRKFRRALRKIGVETPPGSETGWFEHHVLKLYDIPIYKGRRS